MRTVDKTKKSNIKCEHCTFFCGGLCIRHDVWKNYWNRCPSFEWHPKYNEEKQLEKKNC